jgi:hypothetical protein
MKAVMQSTSALIGTRGGVPALMPGGDVGCAMVSASDGAHGGCWNNAAYNKSKANRKRKRHIMRTFAGEQSDSQVDFPAPPNKTPQERSL